MPGLPGHEMNLLWGADRAMQYPDQGAKPDYATVFPPIGGCRLVELYLPAHAQPPNSEADSDFGVSEPAMHLDRNRPGMHRTMSMDVILIANGRCILELDTGKVTLNEGDVLIQSGTMHAWHNPFDQPCRILALLIGAANDLCK